MTRRFCMLVASLALGTLVVTAWGQSTSQRTGFADRMAELRNDWSQPTSPAADGSTRPSPGARQAQNSGTAQGWVGRQGDQAATSTNSQPPQGESRMTLPGLGGSPLPSAALAPSGSHPVDRRDVSKDVVSEHPTIREITPRDPANESPSAARHSPSRPATRQLDPDELRRELVGSFPLGGSSSEMDAATPDKPTSAEQPIFPPSDPLTLPAANEPAWRDGPAQTPSADASLLVSNQTPVISTDIHGPKQILVGREAVFRVKLQNQSSVAAEGVVASIRIPAGAEIVGTAASQGAVQPAGDREALSQLDWQLVRLDARASETLEIRVVPRASRPLELGVSWSLAPVGSRAVVEVQEPKLNLEVSGPNEVLFDKPQVFRLTLSNPGSGPAENVRIELVPPGEGSENAISHALGDLPAGTTKTLEIELTPREAGKLVVKAIASAEGGLAADVAKEIFCRKPELELDWRGPATQYAGTVATYFFRVRNPGTAPADDVHVQVTLPEGAELASASAGHVVDAPRREVKWRVGTLAPGDDNYMELKCVMTAPGDNQLRIVAATAHGDITDAETAQTSVVALADLKLEVVDPSGPVAIGAPAVYEIRIRNRGAGAARNVDVVGLFSEGIEPDQAEGAMHTIADGRVAFRTIDEIPPGRDVTLRIRARGTKPGTHVFRAEVLCRELEIRLATEETTRFYAEESHADAEESQQPFAASR